MMKKIVAFCFIISVFDKNLDSNLVYNSERKNCSQIKFLRI